MHCMEAVSRLKGIAGRIPYRWWLTGIVILLCPALSLPLIAIGIYRQRISAYWYAALFVGLLAWLQYPSGDLLSHTFAFYWERGMSLGERFQAISTVPMLTLWRWGLWESGLPFECWRAFWTAESFLVIALTLRWMANKNGLNRRDSIILILLWILLFEFVKTTFGIRWNVACYNYVAALHLWFNLRRKLWAVALGAMAVSIHVGLLFLIPLSWAAYALMTERRRMWLLAAAGFIIVCGILWLMGSELKPLLGHWGSYLPVGNPLTLDQIDTPSVNGFLLFYMPRMLLLPLVWMAWLRFNADRPWVRMTLAWAALWLMMAWHFTLLYRISVIVAPVGLLCFASLRFGASTRRRLQRILLVCAMLFACAGAIVYRNALLSTPCYEIFYPVPAILSRHYILEGMLIIR